jgi:hypothetical protein
VQLHFECKSAGNVAEFSVPVFRRTTSTWRKYNGQSISFRTEFFALLRSVVTTPAASGVILKVLWASVLKASSLCASGVTQL